MNRHSVPGRREVNNETLGVGSVLISPLFCGTTLAQSFVKHCTTSCDASSSLCVCVCVCVCVYYDAQAQNTKRLATATPSTDMGIQVGPCTQGQRVSVVMRQSAPPVARSKRGGAYARTHTHTHVHVHAHTCCSEGGGVRDHSCRHLGRQSPCRRPALRDAWC